MGIEKCGTVMLKHGRRVENQGISVDDHVIEDIHRPYKYLGILEEGVIDSDNMKKTIVSEYRRRLRSLLKSHLNGANLVKAINMWAVPVVRYTAGIINWTQEEIHKLDTGTRKLLTIHGALHPRSCVERLYMPRNEGGRGLTSMSDIIHQEEKALRKYLTEDADSVTRKLTDILYKENHTEGQSDNRMQNWIAKPLHGQFPKVVAQADIKLTWKWLSVSGLKKETEALICAAQDQALATNNHKMHVQRIQDFDTCRKCHQQGETINHIVAECSALVQPHYKSRHDNVAKEIHRRLLLSHNFEAPNRWYHHDPTPIIENERVKILWDFTIQTDKRIQHNRPDIVMVNKSEQTTYLIDIAIPADKRCAEKEQEKISKYQPLADEIKALWKSKKVEIVPVVIGALGVISTNHKMYMEKLNLEDAMPECQKAALLGTATILRRVLPS